MDLKNAVRQAAQKKGLNGIMALTEFVDMDYRKVVRVWNGDKQAKFSHVEEIFKKLGYQLKAEK
jgi:N-glycosylase/DNA lyase